MLAKRMESCEFIPDNIVMVGEDEEHADSIAYGAMPTDESCLRDLAAGYLDESLGRARSFLGALEDRWTVWVHRA